MFFDIILTAMKHPSATQKQYFQFAYQTGSDIWTHIPYRYKAEQMLPPMNPDTLILDIGAGRGLWAAKLVGLGYRVLGIDYVESIVEKVNGRIQEEGYSDRARFMLGNALEIPFVDNGFDMATDIGTFQHLKHAEWPMYVKEIYRVLKDNAYFLKVSLSKKTPQFLGWNPQLDEAGDFSKFGVYYHFFTEKEIEDTFGKHFTILDQQFETYNSQSDPNDSVVLVFTLMQKK
ncbi:MAG: ubiquinone/menaquinone biosynthesis C-methylase UbiE [Crocinitomicaceae bacterium]|jgi:ubiquinone/menaquinone biosynthesis C-methylase UbiE